MTLLNMIEIWEIHYPDKGFFDDITITTNNNLDKEALLDYLLLEYGNMTTIDDDSRIFHRRVKTFFKTHIWNIDKLMETLEYDYEPLRNTVWKRTDRTIENIKDTRDEKVNAVGNVNGTTSDELEAHSTKDENGTQDRTENTVQKKTGELTTDNTITTTESSTENTNTKNNKTINETIGGNDKTIESGKTGGSDTTTESEKTEGTDTTTESEITNGTDKTTTSGNTKESGTIISLVSAYNQNESPEQIGTNTLGEPIYRYNDTEHDRQTSNKTITNAETADFTTNRNINSTTEFTTNRTNSTTTDFNTNRTNDNTTDFTTNRNNSTIESDTEDSDTTRNSNKNQKENETENTIENTTANKTDKLVTNDNIAIIQNQTKNEKISTDSKEDKTTDEKYNRDRFNNLDIEYSGTEGQSFQSLIEEQRRLVEFNIYKWIGRHFSVELLISIW